MGEAAVPAALPDALSAAMAAGVTNQPAEGTTATLPGWVQIGYLVAAVCFIVALKGLSSPRTARVGNLVGAGGAVLACVITFIAYDMGGAANRALILVAVVIGTVGGVVGARRVQMTQMPQLVALFNGVGGGAAALVALLELDDLAAVGSASGAGPGTVPLAATAFTILVGAVSFAGSLVTFAKLQELMTTRPVVFTGLPILFGASLLAGLAVAGALVVGPEVLLGVALCLIGLVLGLLLVLPVGGADVPIVISLLNAFTGLTVAAGGYVLDRKSVV